MSHPHALGTQRRVCANGGKCHPCLCVFPQVNVYAPTLDPYDESFFRKLVRSTVVLVYMVNGSTCTGISLSKQTVPWEAI